MTFVGWKWRGEARAASRVCGGIRWNRMYYVCAAWRDGGREGWEGEGMTNDVSKVDFLAEI